MSKKILWEKYYPNLEDEPDDELDEDNEEDSKLKTLIQTPFGIFKLNTSLSPFKRFNFWLANTNFSITKGIKAKLDVFEGVEALIILSRYQFIVGIGKMFDEKIVKKGIEEMLCETKQEQGSFKKMLDSTYKYWAAYMFPNANIDYFGGDNIDEVREKVEFYEQARILSHGKIFISKSIKELKI